MRRLFLLLLAILWPTCAGAEWREASSPRFLIYSQQEEPELRRLADQLERLDKALRTHFRRPADPRGPASRLTIYVLRDEDTLQEFIGSRNVAGIYFPRYSGSIAFTHAGRRTSDPDRVQLNPRLVLFHEYTHHFMRSNFSFGAPLWLSEGYAEFWSTVQVEEDGSLKFGLPGGHRAAELTYLRNVPVSQLITLRHPIRDAETFAAIYGRGWVLAHYLNFEPTRTGQLNAYLRMLGEGKTPQEAATAFGDLNELEREVQRYVRRQNHPYVTLRAEQVQPGPISIRVLRPGEQAVMTVRMRSKRGVTERQADDLVPSARHVAERFPQDPLVLLSLAEAEYDAGNFAEAEAAATRAMTLDPRSVDAALYKARALWGRLAANAATRPEQWQEVQRRITAANRIDPDDPEPLVAFFQSFAAAGLPPTRNAIEGLLDAQSLAPEDPDLRLAAARQLLIAGNARGALAMLSPVAADTHSGALGTRVSQVIDVLRGNDTRQALARLDGALAEQQREEQRRR